MALALGRDLLFAVLACAAALLVALTIQLEMTKQELRERSLDETARYIATRIKVEADGTARLVSPAGSAWTSIGYPSLVFGPDGRVLFMQPPGLDPALVAAMASERLGGPQQAHRLGTARFFKLALGDKAIVGEAMHAMVEGEERDVLVWKDENAPDVLIDDVVRDFPYRSAWVLLPLFLLLALGGWLIVWRRTRPLAEISAIAATIGPHSLNLRLREHGLPPELAPIVQAVNGALARLEQAAETEHAFLRRAAHQLRTPLAVLHMRAELLEPSPLGEELRSDVKALARIVGQLLALHEVEALPVGPAEVADLGAIAEAARDRVRPLAAERNCRIALTRATGSILVQGDRKLIEMALCNLLENAVQASGSGSVVEIRVAEDGEVAVADGGTGIPEALRDKIFEPFWSGDRDGRRAGLGLTIVRRVAERNEAALAIQSDANGTTARLRFGLSPASRRSPATASAGISEHSAPDCSALQCRD